MASNEEVREALIKALLAYGVRVRKDKAGKLEAGWTETEEGGLIPPGWVPAPEAGSSGDGAAKG